MMMGLVFLGTVGSVFADETATEVTALIKCHEGKFDAMNAVSQLTAEISGETQAVYGWSGIGAYPDNHMDGHLVKVSAPFTVSNTSFVAVGDVTYACVTVQKK